MKVYLAARYSRRLELCGYRADLEAQGHVVTSRWLNGTHESKDDGLRDEYTPDERSRFAAEDLADLMAAEVCISFTEPARARPARGGRHVEFGAALVAGKHLIVVGHRENVFHCLPGVEFFETWSEALAALQASTPVPA